MYSCQALNPYLFSKLHSQEYKLICDQYSCQLAINNNIAGEKENVVCFWHDQAVVVGARRYFFLLLFVFGFVLLLMLHIALNNIYNTLGIRTNIQALGFN